VGWQGCERQAHRRGSLAVHSHDWSNTATHDLTRQHQPSNIYTHTSLHT